MSPQPPPAPSDDWPDRKFDDFVAPTKIHYVNDVPATLHLRRCKLVLPPAAPGKAPRERYFDGAEISIGSLDDNDLVLSDDTVSRHHCRIVQEDTSYLVVDTGSTNGTFVNRVRVREAYLTPGCTLGLGKVELKFHSADEEVDIVPSDKERLGGAIGRSRKMRELFSIIEKIGPTGTTVVLEGETGTGKEVIAAELHRLSSQGRAAGPMMVFDCGAVPPNLIESELFGHEKGAFTGAVMTRQGLFEMAHGGTLFLDELGELPLELQPKLLRALESREVRRVGGSRPIRVDVRIIAATNRDLEAEVTAGRFRKDLFYRLSVVKLRLPPLRERVEDIPLLVEHLLGKLAANQTHAGSRKVTGVSRDALALLANYRWRGNVRELINVIERAVSLSDGPTIEPHDLPEQVREPGREGGRDAAVPHAVGAAPTESTFKDAKERLVSSFERDYLMNLLKKTNGNISHAAREADIDRKYFRKLMRKYGIDSDEPDEE